MKLFLLILALTLSHISSQENTEDDPIVDGYTELDLAEAKNDPQIQDLLNFGVQYLTNQEVLAQKLPDVEYTVQHIYSIWSQVVSGMNYRFDVDITNDLGWVLRATFVVYSQPWSGSKEVTSYVYDVTEDPNPSEEEEFVLPNGEDIEDGYSDVDPSELDTNADLKDALDAGVQDVVSKAVIDHNLPDSTYKVTQVHSIYGQVVSGMNYRFDVDITNCAGLVARVVFTVFSQPWTQTLETTPGSLDITSIPDEGLVGGDCPDGIGEEEQVWGNEETENSLAGGWYSVEPRDAEDDQIVQDALNFGVRELTKQGINDGNLPNDQYTVGEVHSIQEQVVNGFNYRFDVSLLGAKGNNARVEFQVYSQSWTDTEELSWYRVTSVESSGLGNGVPGE